MTGPRPDALLFAVDSRSDAPQRVDVRSKVLVTVAALQLALRRRSQETAVPAIQEVN